MKITVPYFGDLSCNAYKIYRKGRPGRKGMSGTATKPSVQVWMAKLAYLVEKEQEVNPIDTSHGVVIGLIGHFRSLNSTPDLGNLHKVLDDAIKVGLGVDDREFVHADIGYNTGNIEPTLEITISAKETNI